MGLRVLEIKLPEKIIVSIGQPVNLILGKGLKIHTSGADIFLWFYYPGAHLLSAALKIASM